MCVAECQATFRSSKWIAHGLEETVRPHGLGRPQRDRNGCDRPHTPVCWDPLSALQACLAGSGGVLSVVSCTAVYPDRCKGLESHYSPQLRAAPSTPSHIILFRHDAFVNTKMNARSLVTCASTACGHACVLKGESVAARAAAMVAHCAPCYLLFQVTPCRLCY